MFKEVGKVLRHSVYTPLYFLNGGIDNEIVKKEILKEQKRLIDDPINTRYEDYALSLNSGTEKLETVKLYGMIDEIIQRDFSFPDNPLVAGTPWAHIHKPNESTQSHNHGDSVLSFVYYVSTPANCGNLFFTLEPFLPDRQTVECITGMLMIFPSWYPHGVTKNNSDDYRISISGNYHIN